MQSWDFSEARMPKIAIIVPTYNRADMIGDAIQSVLEQTFVDWELIVVDDGSSDQTRQVVEAFADARESFQESLFLFSFDFFHELYN